MKIKVFGKKNCGKCQSTKNKISFVVTKLESDSNVNFEYHDLDTPDGLCEGAYHGVTEAIPLTIIEKNNEEVARWEGEVPHTDKLKEHLIG